MTEVVIVASSRTPLGKSYRGALNMTRPDDMVAHCLQHVLGKVPQLPVDEVEDVISEFVKYYPLSDRKQNEL